MKIEAKGTEYLLWKYSEIIMILKLWKNIEFPVHM